MSKTFGIKLLDWNCNLIPEKEIDLSFEIAAEFRPLMFERVY